MFHVLARFIWLFLGITSGIFGIIGILLPIIPQVPFILFCIYCFARCSKRFKAWINAQPLYAKYKRHLLSFIEKHEQKTTWYHRLAVWCCRPLVEI